MLANLRAFVEEIRFRNTEIPVFLHGETRTSRRRPCRTTSCGKLNGFIHMNEDTPEFVDALHRARGAHLPRQPVAAVLSCARALRERRELLVALSGALGGVAFLKSPVGQMFHQFFGENLLRADVCNSVDEARASCSTTPGRSRRPSAMPHASSTPTAVLRHQRHVVLEQDGVARDGRAGRHRRRRPQLPQVDPARDHDDRRGAGVPDADAQPPRHHRADLAEASSAGSRSRGRSARTRSRRT